MNNRVVIIVIMLCSITVFSQTKQCISVNGDVGMISLNYNLNMGKCKPRVGFGGKVAYSFYFATQWGIGTGLEFSVSSTDGYLDGAKVSFDNKIDDEGDVYRKDVYFKDWQERQKVFSLEVPILLHYQYDFGLKKRRKLYINMGAKVQLPLMASYQVTRGDLEIQGYYERWNVTLFGMPNHGFGKDGSKTSKGKLKLPLNILATIGLGFSFEVSKMIDIFVGGSFDYGFINLKGESQGDLLYEDNSGNLQYRGLLFSSGIEKVNTISIKAEAGVRIAIGKPVYGGYYRHR
ncbi:MAG: PorT family protein [Bacteroidales bacterium]|jgi:hypothetical protein|nr:PorT family protein [Bacteroidales bacterium]